VVGTTSGNALTNQTNNIIMGNNTTGLVGSNNISIGNITGVTESDTIRIGNGQIKCFIAGIRGASPDIANGLPVVISSTGQLTSQPYPESPVSPGNTGRIAFYNSSSTIGNTGISYTATNDKLSVGANTLISSDLATKNAIAIGSDVDISAMVSSNNIAIGKNSMLQAVTSGYIGNSVALGTDTLRNVTLDRNVAIGHQALIGAIGSVNSRCIAIGHQAGFGLVTGSDNNVCIGSGIGAGFLSGDNNLIVGLGDSPSSINGSNWNTFKRYIWQHKYVSRSFATQRRKQYNENWSSWLY
jgi:carbonic anhydrase/acetyltransferase-like protein (isoleucine patch superfamily)